METSRQRKSSNCSPSISSTSLPLNRTWPPVMTAGGCRTRRIACAMVDLPLPDSPAKPNTSPGARLNDTPSTARAGPCGVTYSTCKSWMSSSGAFAKPLRGAADDWGCADVVPSDFDRAVLEDIVHIPFSAQARVGDFIHPVVDHRQAERNQGNAHTGGNKGPPGAGEQARVILCPVQVRAPTDVAHVGQADQAEGRFRADGICH